MIYVFDFDLTLTKIHSHGTPKISVDYFDGDISNIIKLLKFYKFPDNKIFICSRGIKDDIVNYIKWCNISPHISGVYGAVDANEVNKGIEYWAKKKTNFLYKLKKRYPHERILFYDDTLENIKYAQQHSFSAILTNFDELTQIFRET